MREGEELRKIWVYIVFVLVGWVGEGRRLKCRRSGRSDTILNKLYL